MQHKQLVMKPKSLDVILEVNIFLLLLQRGVYLFITPRLTHPEATNTGIILVVLIFTVWNSLSMQFRFNMGSIFMEILSHTFSFFFNLNFIFLLYNTVLVLPYIDMNPPQVYMSSQPWTPLPPPSPYHLSGSSQCTSPKHPVSCIKPRLAIRFLHDSIHVSMPFSQIIPLSPSPSESKSLFFTSVSLLLSHI